MPRIVRINSEMDEPAFFPQHIVTPRKPDIHLPIYQQMGFKFNSVEESELESEYKRFIPFLFSYEGRKYCTYSEFAVRNGFKLETSKVVEEDVSIRVLEELRIEGLILYIWSEFHNNYRYASVDMKVSKHLAS